MKDFAFFRFRQKLELLLAAEFRCDLNDNILKFKEEKIQSGL
jgi:hypothetical protein